MLRLSTTRFYAVPVLMRALDILELLSRVETPLKTNEVASATKIPMTTTYRILRTLAHRGYIVQDLEGRFSKQNGRAGVSPRISNAEQRENQIASSLGPSRDQVIEIVHGVLQSLNLLQTLKHKEDRERRQSRKIRGEMP